MTILGMLGCHDWINDPRWLHQHYNWHSNQSLVDHWMSIVAVPLTTTTRLSSIHGPGWPWVILGQLDPALEDQAGVSPSV